MAILNHKFNLRNPVLIKTLGNAEGVILAVHLSMEGLQYFVRYFADSRPFEAYFFGHELELDKKRFIDFHGEEQMKETK